MFVFREPQAAQPTPLPPRPAKGQGSESKSKTTPPESAPLTLARPPPTAGALCLSGLVVAGVGAVLVLAGQHSHFAAGQHAHFAARTSLLIFAPRLSLLVPPVV